MTIQNPKHRRGTAPRVRVAALLLALMAATGGVAASAAAEDWHGNQDHREHEQDWRRRGGEGRGQWNGGYYREPPIVYPAPYYYPPPVVYQQPGIGIFLPGIGINIH